MSIYDFDVLTDPPVPPRRERPSELRAPAGDTGPGPMLGERPSPEAGVKDQVTEPR
jgi:hypothetical protein